MALARQTMGPDELRKWSDELYNVRVFPLEEQLSLYLPEKMASHTRRAKEQTLQILFSGSSNAEKLIATLLKSVTMVDYLLPRSKTACFAVLKSLQWKNQ